MLRRRMWLFALAALLPTLAIYAWVRLIPIAETLRLSLHHWNILSRNKPFIGLDNFRELSTDPLFLEALANTTIIAFGVLLLTIPTALVLAALITITRRLALRRLPRKRDLPAACRQPGARGYGLEMDLRCAARPPQCRPRLVWIAPKPGSSDPALAIVA